MQIFIDKIEVLKVADAAILAETSNFTIYEWVKHGYIQTKTHKNQMYIVKQSLIDYLKSRNSPT